MNESSKPSVEFSSTSPSVLLESEIEINPALRRAYAAIVRQLASGVVAKSGFNSA